MCVRGEHRDYFLSNGKQTRLPWSSMLAFILEFFVLESPPRLRLPTPSFGMGDRGKFHESWQTRPVFTTTFCGGFNFLFYFVLGDHAQARERRGRLESSHGHYRHPYVDTPVAAAPRISLGR